MRIRQHAYFALISNTLTAADITSKLRVEPDAIGIRGSETPEPPVPRYHSWRVTSEETGLTVTDHLDRIIDRLGSHAEMIGDLVLELVAADSAPRVGSVLRVVRHFDDVSGEEEEESVLEMREGGRLEKLPGQHQLLGWHLSPRVIDFLWSTHASLDFDEYG